MISHACVFVSILPLRLHFVCLVALGSQYLLLLQVVLYGVLLVMKLKLPGFPRGDLVGSVPAKQAH